MISCIDVLDYIESWVMLNEDLPFIIHVQFNWSLELNIHKLQGPFDKNNFLNEV